MQLAEFNIGILKYDWEDTRVADFRDNLDRVFALAERADGYVWHMKEADMEAAQRDAEGVLGGDPRTASTLSVWRDIPSLEHFVFRTLHKRFYDRRGEWYGPQSAWGGHRLVMWWVPDGHTPTIVEAADRLNHLAAHGDGKAAFGWSFAKATWGDAPPL